MHGTAVKIAFLSHYSFRALRIEIRSLSAPTKTLFYILRILLFMCCYMFRRNRNLQEAYTDVVKTYNNTTVVQ